MRTRTAATRLLGCAFAAALVAAVGGACSSHHVDGGGPASVVGPAPVRGGTLDYLVSGIVDHTDPQRVSDPLAVSLLQRTVYRGLVALPTGATGTTATTPVPDLATSTGVHDAAYTTWSFTLRPGVTWQDGSPVTCDDLVYGAARAFDPTVTGDEAEEVRSWLAVGRDPHTEQPYYRGPRCPARAGHADDLEHAVTCSADDRTITYHLARPWPDLPQFLASTTVLDPFRRTQDHGDRSNFEIFADGPYELRGTWSQDHGGVLVRNPHYDAATDPEHLRGAYPDVVRVEVGLLPQDAARRMLADRGADRDAVATVSPSLLARPGSDVASRSEALPAPDVLCLMPTGPALSRPVRQALALATDRAAFVRAIGGDRAATAARSILSPVLVGSGGGAPSDDARAPRVAVARAVLRRAHVATPVQVTVQHGESWPWLDRGYAALEPAYRRAGLDVNIVSVSTWSPVVDVGPAVVADVPTSWPSPEEPVETVLDTLAGYERAETARPSALQRDALSAESATDPAVATRRWAALEATLRHDGDVVPLVVPVQRVVRGSNVAGVSASAATSDYPDLGMLSLGHPAG